MTHSQKKSKLKRAISAAANGQRLYDPSIFLSPRRIDIAAKTAFARAYLEGNTSLWPEYVYKEHIRAFNNFVEKEPSKNSFDDFKSSFLRTIDGVKNDDSWKHEAPVGHSNGYLVNGAHRVAASIALGDKINVEVPEVIHVDNYNYSYFRRDRSGIDGINEDALDYMTIEYVSLKKKNIFIAIIFPTAEGLRQEAYQHLLQLGEIVNMKTFSHDEFIGKEVIKQLYFNSNNDAWNYGLSFDSARNKADLCFAGTGDLQVYVIEANLSESTRIKEKQYLRNLWNKDKHSIHITDTMEEANRVVRMFFNENSRRFMKVDRQQEFASQAMYDMFNEYMKAAPKNLLEREKIAIEGSAVLDLLNIRSGRDIDYVSRDESINFKTDTIERHSGIENNYHSESIDEITTNPQYYFYYKGYKFVDVVELQKYKQNRAVNKDPKDLKDLRYLSNFMLENPQYGINRDDSRTNLPLVSVIIPVYNTRKEYLLKCFDSIKSQNYSNIEIIVVDDGSDKESAELLDDYIGKLNDEIGVKKWQIIHQKHKGLANARNRGYAAANGLYIQFLDSDDYTYRKLISSAVDRAESTGAEIVIENFTIRDYTTGSERVAIQEDQLPSAPLFKLVDVKGGIGSVPCGVWSKLFRKDFLDRNSLLHDGTLQRAEDVLFSYSALTLAKKITFLPEFYITYREDLPESNSKTNDAFPLASVAAWSKLHDLLMSNDSYKTFKNDFERAMLESITWHYYKLKTPDNRKKLAKEAVQLFEKMRISLKDDRYAMLLLASVDPELTRVVDDRVAKAEFHINMLMKDIDNITEELNYLRKPSVKLATLKLAGSVKRKVKRIFSKNR